MNTSLSLGSDSATSSASAASRNLRVLTHLFGFLRPYRRNLAAALLALFIAVGALLGFGVVLQRVVALQFRDALGA